MKFCEELKKSLQRKSLQFLLSLTFTAVSVAVLIVVAVGYSKSFVDSAEKMAVNNNQNVLNQVNKNLDNYLHSMMSISNTIYYSIIKNFDLGKDSMDKMKGQMKLLYEANGSSLISIAVFDDEGEVIVSQPLSRLKPKALPNREEWFIRANEKIENVHFTTPHVENLFVNTDNVYHWVVSLSRYVNMTKNGAILHGVVLVNMNFTGIEQICKNVDLGESGYVYLVDQNGELIYHPDQQLIYAGVIHENYKEAASYPEGSYKEIFENQERQITVKSVGYTGWKLIGVSPTENITSVYMKNSRFLWSVVVFAILILIIVNAVVSSKVAKPIKQLELSVRELERNNLDVVISQSGTYEIQHLAKTLQSMAVNVRRLMDEIVLEQESKRKSEMAALQSQINPHFLYNTLDSIVWMIENERYEGAITMVTALARLFRISLSKGKNIITASQELQHVENYLIIQMVRYKNKFTYNIQAEEKILSCAVIKLSIQPLVENSIYHGLEFMDGEGEINIRAYQRDRNLIIEVEDNGPGMTKEQVESLLNGTARREHKQGAGVGFHNVEERIQLYFGKEYGLEVESEPDEGTVVRARFPLLSIEEGEKEE